jgi:hypothetical protein
VSGQVPSALKRVRLAVTSAPLVVYRTGLTAGRPGTNHLAYAVQVSGANSVREFVYVDALTGKIVDQITGMHGLNRRVCLFVRRRTDELAFRTARLPAPIPSSAEYELHG